MHALQRQKSLEGAQVQEVRVLRVAPEGEGAEGMKTDHGQREECEEFKKRKRISKRELRMEVEF